MFTYKLWGVELPEENRDIDDGEYRKVFRLEFTQGDHFLECTNYGSVERIRETLTEEKLLATEALGNGDNPRFEPFGCISVYRSLSTIISPSPWFLTKKEATIYATELGHDEETLQYDRGVLSKSKIKVPMLPFEVELEQGPKGLFVKMELHPDKNGTVGGKYYFPHRNCQNLVPGPAIVHAIHDRNTYGFIDVEMKKYTTPEYNEMAELLMQIADRDRMANILIMQSPFGTFPVGIACTSSRTEWLPVCRDANGNVAFAEELAPYLSSNLCPCKTLADYKIRDYITTQGYGMTEKDFSRQFVICGLQFPEAEDYPYTEDELKDPTMKLIDEMEEMLVIQRKRIADAIYYSIDHNGLYAIAGQFTKDEIAAIISHINAVNTEAIELITKYLKTGRFRMTL